jgi:REP element-mobilizing transposase RayT
MANPIAYFITFTCYGSHLHGAEPASVDRDHNTFGARRVIPDPARLVATEILMKDAPYVLDAAGRQIVLQTIQEVCSHRRWNLIAAHVRTTHVHVVVEAEKPSEGVLHDFKAYATRRLNQHEGRTANRWTRHGSTRYLWKEEDVAGAVDYVMLRQGEPMSVFSKLELLADSNTAP